MLLQYVTRDKLEDLSQNFEKNLEYYENQDKKWFQNYLQQGNGLISYGNEIPDFVLSQNENYNVSDLENIKILHQNLKELPLSVASDERFWTGLSHTTFFDYIWYRQGEEIKKSKDNDKERKKKIKGAYFRNVAGRRGIFVNCLSRLWWTGYLVYDKNRADPYELAKPLMYGKSGHSYASQIMLISARNFTSNRELFHGIMQAMLDFSKDGNELKREVFETVLTYFNNISAVTILDLLSEKDAYDIAIEQLEEYKKRNPKSSKPEKEEELEEVSEPEMVKEIAAPQEAPLIFKPAPAVRQPEEPKPIVVESPVTYATPKKPIYAGSFEAKKKRRSPKGKVSSSSKGPITRTVVFERTKKK